MNHFVVVFILFFISSNVALGQGMSLKQLVSLKSVNQAKMAFNEKRIAFTQNVPRDLETEKPGPDWQELYVAHRKGLIRPLIKGKNQIAQIKWNRGSDQIWLLMRRQNDAYFGIYMIRPDGGEAGRIVSKTNHIYGFDLHPEDNKILYWYPDQDHKSRKPKDEVEVIEYDYEFHFNHHLHEINLDAEDTTKDIKLTEWGHILKAQYSPDGEKLLIKGAPSYVTDQRIMQSFFLVTNGAGKVLHKIANRGKLSKALFSPNGKKVAFIGAETPSSPDHGSLFISDITSGETRLLISNFKGTITDIGWPENRNILFLADIGLGSILGIKNTNDPSDNYLTLLKSKLVLRKLHSPDDNDTMALIANHYDHPNELFWYKSQKLRRVTGSNDDAIKQQLGRQTSHSFDTVDGFEIQAVMVAPKHASDEVLPTIIFAHGGPEAHVSNGWNGHYSRPVHPLASMGYRSFMPNYRGSSGRGEAFLKAGQGDFGGAEFDDILAAKKWLVKKGYAKEGQIGIAGSSYGGYAAAWAATRFSEHFQAAVSIAGIGNKVSKFGTSDIPSEILQTHALAQPWESWESWLTASPIYYSDKHRTPILLMHGQQDRRVLFSQSMELYRHLKHRNQAPVQLLLYPNSAHQVLDAHTQYHQAQRMLNWFEQYLKTQQ